MFVVALISAALATQSVAAVCSEFAIHPEDEAIVEDAAHLLPGGAETAGRYTTIVLQMSDLRCVHFRINSYSMGPSPTFCYDQEDRLVETHGTAH